MFLTGNHDISKAHMVSLLNRQLVGWAVSSVPASCACVQSYRQTQSREDGFEADRGYRSGGL